MFARAPRWIPEEFAPWRGKEGAMWRAKVSGAVSLSKVIAEEVASESKALATDLGKQVRM